MTPRSGSTTWADQLSTLEKLKWKLLSFETAKVEFFIADCIAGLSLEKEPYSVYKAGLNNQTEADGLAVGSASLLVASMMRHLVSDIFTVPDQSLFNWLSRAEQTESLKIEPSAAASFPGPINLLQTRQGQYYLQQEHLKPVIHNATHLLWTTGGMMVPDEEFEGFLRQGRSADLSTC